MNPDEVQAARDANSTDVFTDADRTRTWPPPEWESWDPAEFRMMQRAQNGENITDTPLFQRAKREIDTLFVGGGRPAWHGLGTVIDADVLTADDALVAAGLDWQVDTCKMMAFTPDAAPLEVGDITIPALPTIEVPGHVANVRRDTGTVLGVVGDGYQLLQNTDAFAFMDELVASADAKYHTAGSLYGGRQVWLMLKLDKDIRIGGQDDEILDPYLMLSNRHDGAGALTVVSTPVRAACGNGVRLAIRGAKASWKTNHTLNMRSRVDQAREVLRLAVRYYDDYQTTANDLLDTTISMSEFTNRFVPMLVPMPTATKDAKLTDRVVDNVEATRSLIISMYQTSPNLENIRGTGWGAYNAVAEYVDYISPMNSSKRNSAADRRFDRAFVQDAPLKVRAQELLATR